MKVIVAVLFLLTIVNCVVWENVFPSPTDGTINSGVYGPEGFLLFGDEGFMATSSNGSSWETCYSPLDGDYQYSSYTNGYYARSNLAQGITAYSSSINCHNPIAWEFLGNFMGGFSLDYQFAPSPVPTGYAGGFVGISNRKAYFSSTGAPIDLQEILAINYDLFEAWAVHYANNTFLIKLAGRPNTNIEFDVYFISSTDGITWTAPQDSEYTAFYDYSLSFCSTSQKWIMASNEGICVSTDGQDWYLTLSSPNFKFSRLACFGDRCVASNYTNLFDSNNCKYFQEITPVGLVMSDGFPLVSPTGTFIVAGQMGAIQYSNTYLQWYSSGAPYSQTGEFVSCRELIAGDNFYTSCMQSIFVSSDGINWRYKPYKLSTTSTVQITSLLYQNNQLLGLGGGNKIYTSTTAGTTWTLLLQFNTESGSSVSIEYLKYTGGMIIGVGETMWGSSLVPMLAIGQGVENWSYFATNVWLYDVTYFSEGKTYIGAGEGGVYYADDFYNWNLLSSINGRCTVIVYEVGVLTALCFNEGIGNTLDQVLKVSTDGDSWVDYYSPCSYTYRLPHLPQTCGHLSFIPAWNKLVLYSENSTGTIYASEDGLKWGLVEFPYAMSIHSMVQLNNTIGVLTGDSILTGSAGETVFAVAQAIPVYSESTNSSYNPQYVKVGPIGTQTVGVSEDSSDTSNSGMNGGDIFGIIVAIFVIMFIVLVIIVAAFLYTRYRKLISNKEARPILAGTDENELL